MTTKKKQSKIQRQARIKLLEQRIFEIKNTGELPSVQNLKEVYTALRSMGMNVRLP